ncbi:hypothetical protein Hdeb2414_s0014g00432361 [Helianthus debilis subsp. tardiflorus]
MVGCQGYGIFKPISQKSLCLEKQRNFLQNLEAGLFSTMLIKEKGLLRNKQAKNFWYDISEKAKASANANTNFSRLGRTGYAGLDAKADTIWPILEAKYLYLKNIQDKRAKAWIMSQKIKNPETNSYELAPESLEKIERLVRTEREMIVDGSYFAGKDDPIIRVMGREHGGRTRVVSEVIGSTNVYEGLFNNGKKRARNGDSLDVN